MRVPPLLACLICAGILASASTMAASPESIATRGAPAIRHVNGIDYVSGGIGVEEMSAMRAIAGRFNVHMQFVNEVDGSSLADVTVTLFNARREIVLLVLSEGPLLYLQLPPGDYRALVRSGGAIDCRSVQVRADGRGPSLLLRLPGESASEILSRAPERLSVHSVQHNDGHGCHRLAKK